MKETKEELRQQIHKYELEKIELQNSIKRIEEKAKQELADAIKKVQEDQEFQAYQKFKNDHGKFLSYFMNEYIRENLKVDVSCDYNETVTVEVSLDGEVISTSEDYIKHGDDPRCLH